jgi:low affinity Fe/Cu permease
MNGKKLRVFWIVLLVILFCGISVESSYHFHPDGKRHNDCSLCNFEKTLFTIDLAEAVSITLEFVLFQNVNNQNILPFFHILTNSVWIRPPPASFF